MCRMLIENIRTLPIKGGVVHLDAMSGDERITWAIPIDEYRMSVEDSIRALDEFDAQRAVVRLRPPV